MFPFDDVIMKSEKLVKLETHKNTSMVTKRPMGYQWWVYLGNWLKRGHIA